jgi:hypothetical protein
LASVFDAITATKEDDHHGDDNDKGSQAGMMRATTTITTISTAMTIQMGNDDRGCGGEYDGHGDRRGKGKWKPR